jgi:hypothetical protein
LDGSHPRQERVSDKCELAGITKSARHYHGTVNRCLEKLRGPVRIELQHYRTLLDSKRHNALKPFAKIFEMALNGCRNWRRESGHLNRQDASKTKRRRLILDAALPILNISEQLAHGVGSAAIERLDLGSDHCALLFNDGDDEIGLGGEMMVDAWLPDPETLGQVGIAKAVVADVCD